MRAKLACPSKGVLSSKLFFQAFYRNGAAQEAVVSQCTCLLVTDVLCTGVKAGGGVYWCVLGVARGPGVA